MRRCCSVGSDVDEKPGRNLFTAALRTIVYVVIQRGILVIDLETVLIWSVD